MIFIICIQPDPFYTAHEDELCQAVRLLFDRYPAIREVRYGLSLIHRDDFRNTVFDPSLTPLISCRTLLETLIGEERLKDKAAEERICVILFMADISEKDSLSDLCEEAEAHHIKIRLCFNRRIPLKNRKRE
ncbi:MAG: hypothetical protein IJ252_10605 [Solobacterium sp.]|nr:hypothetical protein [Solobacterium sp.]